MKTIFKLLNIGLLSAASLCLMPLTASAGSSNEALTNLSGKNLSYVVYRHPGYYYNGRWMRHHNYRPVGYYRYYHRPYCRMHFSWRHGGWFRTCGHRYWY